MATSKLRAPDGSIVTVEHEAGASPEHIKALAVKQHGQPKPAATVAGPPPAPPAKDAVGRAKEALTKEPPAGDRTAVSRAIFGDRLGSWDTPGRAVRAAGDLMLPETWGQAARQAATLPIPGSWVTAPLKRIAAGSTAGATADSISEGSSGVMDFATKMARHGGEQALGEVLPAALGFGLTQRAARGPLAEQAAKKAARDAAEATRQANARPEHEANAQRIRSQHSAIEETRRGQYERDKAADAERTRDAKAQHDADAQRVKQEHARIEETRTGQHKRAEAEQKAAHAEATARAREEHAGRVREYEQTGARTIADAFKARVQAFRDFSSDEAGLLGMVFGTGPARLSAVYDRVMRDIARQGRGQDVVIPGRDAAALGLKPTGVVQAVDPRQPDMARVDAAQLAEAVTGLWKKNPGLYRRAAHALDDLGIGNPEARAEYKAGMALIDFTAKSKMLKGERFNPEAARNAFTDVKVLDTLRRRGHGDIFEGPIADAVRRPRPALNLPGAPAPIPPPRPLAKPLIPPFRAPAGTAVEPRPLGKPFVPPFRPPTPLPEVPDVPDTVRLRKLPDMGFWEGAALAELPFLVGGIASGHYSHAYGLPAAAGGLAAKAMRGRSVATEAPLSPLSKFATRVLPPILGQEAAERMERREWPAPAR